MSASAGDQAVILSGATFFATARIATTAARTPDWSPRDYSAGLDSTKLIKRPIVTETIRKGIPNGVGHNTRPPIGASGVMAARTNRHDDSPSRQTGRGYRVGGRALSMFAAPISNTTRVQMDSKEKVA
jgi:hypothetical protein